MKGELHKAYPGFLRLSLGCLKPLEAIFRGLNMRVENKSPNDLSLDKANPRFGLAHAQTEEEALEILAETANLKELWDSIAERGYEPFEPLVAMEKEGRLVVLEGNRRLAAVKLLLDPDLLKRKPLGVAYLDCRKISSLPARICPSSSLKIAMKLPDTSGSSMLTDQRVGHLSPKQNLASTSMKR